MAKNYSLPPPPPGAPSATGFGGSATQNALGASLPPPPPAAGVTSPTQANAAPAGRPPSPYAKDKQQNGAGSAGGVSVFGSSAPTSLMGAPTAAPAPPPAPAPVTAASTVLPTTPSAAPGITVYDPTNPTTAAQVYANTPSATSTPGTVLPPQPPKPIVSPRFNEDTTPAMETIEPNPYSPGTKEFRQFEAAKGAAIDRNLANGYSLADMGKENKKERGQAAYSQLAFEDAFGPGSKEGQVYDLGTGTMHQYGNRGPGGAGPTHDYGDQTIPADQLAEIQKWQQWKSSPEARGWMKAYGVDPYQAWLIKNKTQRWMSPKAGNITPFQDPTSGQTVWYNLDGNQQLSAVWDKYGRNIAAPASLLSQLQGSLPPPPPSAAPASAAPNTWEATNQRPDGTIVGGPPSAQAATPQPPSAPVQTLSSGAVLPPAPPAPAPTTPSVPTGPGPAQPAEPQHTATPAPTAAAPTPTTQPPTTQPVAPQPSAVPPAAAAPAAAPTGPPTAAPAAPAPAAPAAAALGAPPAGPQMMAISTAPTPQHMDELPPGGTISSPVGTFTKDPTTGKVSVVLSAEGQRRLAAAHQRAARAFGNRPFATDPRAPQPPIVPGRYNYNPFGEGFTRG